MAFRRTRRRFGTRRRRRSPETYTIVECNSCENLWVDATCTNPLIDVFELMVMQTKKNPFDTTEIVSPSDKFLVVDGIKFQYEYSHDPNQTLDCPGCDPCPSNTNFILKVWEAIMVLPLLQGSSVPAYVPNLTNPAFQRGDTADRVLWKRITMNPIWGINGFVGLGPPQLQFTVRDQGHGPVVVKSKVRLDDRHGLFYVKNYVHDVFTGVTGPQPCNTAGICDIPIITDGWFKIFYHSRK